MTKKVIHFVENNFSLLLIIGALSGFFLPSLGMLADEVVIILTAFLIFLSCSDIDQKAFFQIDIYQMGVFTLVRFAIFPLIFFYLVSSILPEFSTGILLLALMPAGVAVASLCSMSKANVVIGLSLTIISSLLAPFVIPSVFSFLGQVVSVNIWDLFLTLVYVVFVPIILYFFIFDKIEQTKKVIKAYNKTTAVLVLSIILAIVIATQKEEIFSNIDLIVKGLLVMTAVYAVFYAFGILYSFFLKKEEKIPYILASGANNNSLAVGLSFAYFDPLTSLFIVLSEVVWSFYVATAQYIFSRRKID